MTFTFPHRGSALYIVALVSALTSLYARAEAKELTLEEAKAHYVVEIIKHVTWPDEETFKTFKIGTLGISNDAYKALKEKQAREVRGKSIVVERLQHEPLDPSQYQIIFAHAKKRSVIKDIFSRSPTTLIISDGKLDEELLLVGLIDIRKKLSITLSGVNLTKRGFDASISLLEYAGTKEDMSELLKEKKQRLDELLKYVEEKERTLEEINKALDAKTERLNSAESKLKDNNQKLGALVSEIESSHKEVLKNKEDIEQQQKLIDSKQQELRSKQSSIEQLQNSIDENKKILEEQSDIIEVKEKTIGTQRDWLYFVLMVVLAFFVMTFFLFRANLLRKRANKELQTLNEQLYELATTDSLTKLSNRRHFLESAENEFTRQHRKHKQSSMFMLDIDHFKQVNDNFGHAMGDEAIKSVATLLKRNLRKYDLVGRLGGEEFAMMLIDCDENLVKEIAERICAQIESLDITWEGITINVTISIGISPLLEDDTSIEQSLVRADHALYSAKESGRNRYCLYSDAP